ncbi:MAG: bifunctional homocysteine S-methyltransferase/methylenetetrahydrofolate reductase [Acidobacteria bacterium]|nr:bifunctional homocysteine S-methyltransferase/methylenetetrahydrofolate reductase [Acidobacteriota bacterium]MBI3427596.1 bifunctional homocysteine S-methyltransferase/methylenetetrahydrofolate reductase [Acidobacteriota bacterium]
MKNFRDFIQADRVRVFDGAMGTMIYSKGVYINRSYDELNLSAPDLIANIHREYIKAGAEIIETNTYGASRLRLAKQGLDDKLAEINAAAVKLARNAIESAKQDVFIAGAISPIGVRIEPYGPTSVDEARALFKEQAQVLLENGVDCFVLETFHDLAEMRQAILAVRELCDHVIFAQMTINERGETAFGTAPEVFTERLDAWLGPDDIIGLNCSVGPQTILEAVEKMRPHTTRRLSAQPNAGNPRDVGGRRMYMASPDYLGEYAKRLISAGVRFVGGCCGTTPEHIKLMVDAARALSPGRTSIAAVTHEESASQAVPPTPFAERSRWAKKIANNEFVTSVEIVPPKGCDPSAMLKSVRLLKDNGVDAVNVPDGPRAQSRMGALAVSLIIEQQVGLEAVTHYACRDRNLLGMFSDLLGAAALGLRNFLLVTGDPPKMGPYPDATAVFDIDAIGLCNLVNRLNHGIDPGGNSIGEPTKFVIGVGVNPGAQDLDYELRRFEYKVEAGAEYAITQPVFDTDQLKTFLKRIEHCRIPIIPGIWPLVSFRNAEFLNNEVPGVTVPDNILERMRNCEDGAAALKEGIKIAQEMLAEVRPYVQGVQVSAPFGRVPFALEVFEALR